MLGSRALRLEPQRLKDISLPVILHWDMDHFVVLKEIRRNRFVVFDPAHGRVTYSLDEISKHFTGVALEVTPATDFQPIVARTRTRLTSLWSRLSGLKRSLIQILILSVVIQLFGLASPFYLQLVIDEAVTRFDTDFLFLLGIGFGCLYLIRAVTVALRSWVILLLGQSMTFQMAGNVLRHLIRLPAAYFEKRHAGDIISRMDSIDPIPALGWTVTPSCLMPWLPISAPCTAKPAAVWVELRDRTALRRNPASATIELSRSGVFPAGLAIDEPVRASRPVAAAGVIRLAGECGSGARR